MKKVPIIILGCYFLMNVLTAQSYTPYFTGNVHDIITTPKGGVCLMGGGRENSEAMKWFLERADGGDVVVLRASGSDGYNDYMYNELGVDINSVTSFVFHDRSASYDTMVLNKIKNAEAIWIAGGDQWNYVKFWLDSPVDSIINEGLKNRNIVIGGTSAGMAILGGFYFSAENNTITSSEALANPFDEKITLDHTPFIDLHYLEDVVTDTHYDQRDRRGRHIAFIARILIANDIRGLGIACNERTAVCINENGRAYVYGTYPDFESLAYFIQPDCSFLNNTPEQYQPGMPLIWDQDGKALKVYVVKGTLDGKKYFDLSDRKTGKGGHWETWSVKDKKVINTTSQPIACKGN